MRAGFEHEALLYRSADEYLRATLPFIRDGVARGEAILVATSERNARLMRERLNGESEAVTFADIATIGRNPARIIPVWRQFVDENLARGRAFRGIGEPVWPGRTPPEIDECQRHEALLNLAFDGGPAWPLLCPYDASALPADVVASAEHSHPRIDDSNRPRSSHAYDGHERAREALSGALPDPPGTPVEFGFENAHLALVRHLVAGRAREVGLPEARVPDFVVAVNELATNSVLHGGGSGLIRIWGDDGGVACDVADAGRIDDPLAGRVTPIPEQLGGRGLWIANQLCDLVQLRSSALGTVVRAWMRVS